jgi:hypothetical protein
LFTPQSLKDEYITVNDLSKTDDIVGQLNVFAFVQPTDDLYLQIPARPAAVYTYDVKMERIARTSEAKKQEISDTLYPYIPRTEGPVELDQYFGY